MNVIADQNELNRLAALHQYQILETPPEEIFNAIAPTQVEKIEISSMRTSQQIKTEVEQTLGFFPPFFSSALDNPQVFENLWQQTLSAYLNNPLSPIFKEKLSAYLSRYCTVPYCMIVHSCSLRPLGVEAREVLRLLQAPPPQETQIDKHLQVLQAQPNLQTSLPVENSAVEESLLYCAIYIAIAKEEAEFYKFELRRLLGNINYQHLITFIAYVKTCHEWMEAYPEVMYEEDQRATNYLAPLIAEEPGLADFFRSYVEQVKIERQTWATQLAQLEERKRNEQALRLSEEKFRSLVEQTNDWIWEIDTNAIFTYVSPQVQKIVGYEPADLIGKTTFDLMSVSESERFLLVIGEFLSKQAPFTNLEKTLMHKNGNLVVLETSGSPVFDVQGVLIGYRGIARDVTERKHSEQALRRSEQRIRIINEAIPQQVWTARPNGSLDYVNKRVLDYFDSTFEEMIDAGWQSVIHPEDLPGCLEIWGKSLTTGEPYEIEFRLFKASVASYRWYLGRAVPIYDEDGRIVSWFGTNTDIHDRKLAEEERKLAQAELQLQNRRSQLFSEISLKIRQSLQLEEILETTVTEVKRILQADRVLVYRIWADGTGSAIAESVNPQWSSILEQTFPSEVFSEEYLELYSQGRIRAISDVTNGELAPCLTDFVQTFNVKAKLVVPIILNGQLWGLLIAHQCEHTRQWSSFEIELLEQLANQISIALAQSQLLEQETRQRLELMRSNEELQQFAYIASHDLQEPLRKIQAFGDRLKVKHSNVLNEQGIDYLERMQSAAQRMQVLINDLLALSRVTSKAQRFVTVDLNKVVKEVLSDLEIRIQQTKGRVEVENLPTIDADPLQMRQLIQNLISNALKFHPKEEAPVIKIYSKCINNYTQQPPNFSPVSDTYEIVVEDNGIGFDEKYLDRIFNVFQRLHSRSEYEGTGMGLAICRKIVEQHNGSITAYSQLGQGAKFIVTLPSIANKGENHIEGATTSNYINGG